MTILLVFKAAAIWEIPVQLQTRISASCNKQLSEIEGRLEMLVHSADGGLEVEPFSFEDDVEGKATS